MDYEVPSRAKELLDLNKRFVAVTNQWIKPFSLVFFPKYGKHPPSASGHNKQGITDSTWVHYRKYASCMYGTNQWEHKTTIFTQRKGTETDRNDMKECKSDMRASACTER